MTTCCKIDIATIFSQMKKVGSGFSPLVVIDRQGDKPLHRQIYDAFSTAIRKRNLHAGQRVPSSRALALELKISRIPVLSAYSQLHAEGYFETRTGSGTFISGSRPDRKRPIGHSVDSTPVIQADRRLVSRRSTFLPPFHPQPGVNKLGAFVVGQVAIDQFPFGVWSRLSSRNAHKLRVGSLQYANPLGCERLRQTIAEYLKTTRAVNCDAAQIMIVSGSQQALQLCAHALLDPGDKVWMEEPGYWLAHHVFLMTGCRLVPVPVDAEGLNVQAGMEISREARAAFVTPSHQFPLGATMTASRRAQLLEWAHSAAAWIIENDYDSEYRYNSRPVESLQGLDPNGRVIYIGTFSKILFPCMRLGYVVIPPDLVSRFLAVRQAMDVCPPHLYQAIVKDFIDDGHFARHIRRMRPLYAERRTALVEAIRNELPDAQLLGADAGLHLVVTLPKGLQDRSVSEWAARGNLWLWPLSPCYLEAEACQGLILGFGSTPPKQMPQAVRTLRDAIKSA